MRKPLKLCIIRFSCISQYNISPSETRIIWYFLCVHFFLRLSLVLWPRFCLRMRDMAMRPVTLAPGFICNTSTTPIYINIGVHWSKKHFYGCVMAMMAWQIHFQSLSLPSLSLSLCMCIVYAACRRGSEVKSNREAKTVRGIKTVSQSRLEWAPLRKLNIDNILINLCHTIETRHSHEKEEV